MLEIGFTAFLTKTKLKRRMIMTERDSTKPMADAERQRVFRRQRKLEREELLAIRNEKIRREQREFRQKLAARSKSPDEEAMEIEANKIVAADVLKLLIAIGDNAPEFLDPLISDDVEDLRLEFISVWDMYSEKHDEVESLEKEVERLQDELDALRNGGAA